MKYPPLGQIKIPEVASFTLANGMKVYLLENHELPLVGGFALIRTGNLFEPADKVGLAQITGSVLRTGGFVLASFDGTEGKETTAYQALAAVLGGLDTLVFTGGIGENAAPIRKRCCQGLEGLGITVDDRKNEKAYEEVLEIQRDGAPVKVLAVRTNEEREIAEQTINTIKKTSGI